MKAHSAAGEEHCFKNKRPHYKRFDRLRYADAISEKRHALGVKASTVYLIQYLIKAIFV